MTETTEFAKPNARPIWSGAVSFGLVNVPVRAYPAVKKLGVSFRQIAPSGARVRQRRVDESTGAEVPYDQIRKGYELAPDRHLLIEDAHLAALSVAGEKAITLESFVDASEVDPIVYDGTYYLGAASGAACGGYRLLAEVLERTGRAGVGRIVMRGRQYLAVLRASEGVLLVSTLLYADEVRDRSPFLPPRAELREREVAAGVALVEALASTWDEAYPTYRDEYREAVLALIERRASEAPGLTSIPSPNQPEDQAPEPTDVIAALEASLAQTRAAA